MNTFIKHSECSLRLFYCQLSYDSKSFAKSFYFLGLHAVKHFTLASNHKGCGSSTEMNI